jgi:hypothetical protein
MALPDQNLSVRREHVGAGAAPVDMVIIKASRHKGRK